MVPAKKPRGPAFWIALAVRIGFTILALAYLVHLYKTTPH